MSKICYSLILIAIALNLTACNKTVSEDKFNALLSENNILEMDNTALQDENIALRDENENLRQQLEENIETIESIDYLENQSLLSTGKIDICNIHNIYYDSRNSCTICLKEGLTCRFCDGHLNQNQYCSVCKKETGPYFVKTR